MTAKKGTLPRIREIAEDLQDGADFAELCERYDVSGRLLTGRLSYAGYGTDGRPLTVEKRTEPLDAAAYGEYVDGGVGGGDQEGLPLEPVPHTRRARRRFLGLDWSTSPASGPRWELF